MHLKSSSFGAQLSRFLPSIVVLLAILVVLVLADKAQVRAMEMDKRKAAEAMLHDVQIQFDGYVSSAVRSVRRLAARIDPSFDIDQQRFETLVAEAVVGSADLHRVELAPGFVTRLVYPQDGNASYLGEIPLSETPEGRPDLEKEIARGFPVLASIQLDENGFGELQVQAEVRQVVGRKIISVGMARLTATFNLSIPAHSENAIGRDLELLILSQPTGTPPPETPEGWRDEEGFESVTQIMRYPPGDFLLFLRPTAGWRPTSSEMSVHRLRYSGLALILFLPVVLANWFAVTREQTRGDLFRAKDEMEGILRNLPGAALSITVPPGNRAPGPTDEIRFLNREAGKTIWGVSAEVFEENPTIFWNSIASREHAQRLSESVSRSLDTLEPISEVWPIRAADGGQRWLLGWGHPIRLADGSTRWSVMIFDNTQQVEHERELEHQRELTFQAQKQKSIGHLTAGVAHDFNNLLSVIVGSLELLAENETDPRRRELTQTAMLAISRGADLTRSMLAFSGQARLSPEVLDLNAVLDESRRWIERTLPDSVSLVYSLSDDLGPVFADRSSTESVILNLILNACDAMENRGVLTVETANVSEDPAGRESAVDERASPRYVRLVVSDTGRGIADEDLRYVFEPFFTTKESSGGSGLGLSMVAGFMRQTGGTVSVDTDLGHGTSFSLLFPVAVRQEQIIAPKEREASPSPLADLRILIAEDNESVRQILALMLEGAGHRVVAASSGDDALSIFRRDPAFDVLVSDVVMPGTLQGPDLAEKLRKTVPNLAVVLLSGYSEDFGYGDDGSGGEYVRSSKPLRRLELLAAVENAVRSASRTGQLS